MYAIPNKVQLTQFTVGGLKFLGVFVCRTLRKEIILIQSKIRLKHNKMWKKQRALNPFQMDCIINCGYTFGRQVFPSYCTGLGCFNS